MQVGKGLVRHLSAARLGGFTVRATGTLNDDYVMRFDSCIWQPLTEGRVRHVVTFVSKDSDTSGANAVALMFEPVRSRLVDHALAAKVRTDVLISILRDTGVLTQEAVDQINQASISFAERRDFDRINDAERFML